VPAITFRPIRPGDAEFLYRLYASTRQEELRPVPWTDAQKAAFLRQQFHAQHVFYQEQYPGARFEVILLDGDLIGRLYVDRRDDEIRIVDIALVLAHRGGGHGGGIVRALLAEAAAAGKPVRLHVERLNPARRFYERLGFVEIADKGFHALMECRPGSDPPQVKTAS
jgi:RimJ/RimL family protein N-acetyltransferase